MRKVKHYFDKRNTDTEQDIDFKLNYENRSYKCVCSEITFEEMKSLMDRNNLKTF